eukprot:9408014-Pyramimonas_sp.AAC.1
MIEESVESSGVLRRLGLYGFQLNRKTFEITAALKNMGQHASNWRDQELHVAICDIRRAFDHAAVGKLREALQWSQ